MRTQVEAGSPLRAAPGMHLSRDGTASLPECPDFAARSLRRQPPLPQPLTGLRPSRRVDI